MDLGATIVALAVVFIVVPCALERRHQPRSGELSRREPSLKALLVASAQGRIPITGLRPHL